MNPDTERHLSRTMRMEVTPVIKGDEFTGKMDLTSPMKIRKVIYWPNGVVHSKYGLSFVTGEWIKVAGGAPYPTECIMDDKLRELLDPGLEPMRSYRAQHPGMAKEATNE